MMEGKNPVVKMLPFNGANIQHDIKKITSKMLVSSMDPCLHSFYLFFSLIHHTGKLMLKVFMRIQILQKRCFKFDNGCLTSNLNL